MCALLHTGVQLRFIATLSLHGGLRAKKTHDDNYPANYMIVFLFVFVFVLFLNIAFPFK